MSSYALLNGNRQEEVEIEQGGNSRYVYGDHDGEEVPSAIVGHWADNSKQFRGGGAIQLKKRSWRPLDPLDGAEYSLRSSPSQPQQWELTERVQGPHGNFKEQRWIISAAQPGQRPPPRSSGPAYSALTPRAQPQFLAPMDEARTPRLARTQLGNGTGVRSDGSARTAAKSDLVTTLVGFHVTNAGTTRRFTLERCEGWEARRSPFFMSTFNVYRHVTDAKESGDIGALHRCTNSMVVIPEQDKASNPAKNPIHFVEGWDVMLIVILLIEAYRVPYDLAFGAAPSDSTRTVFFFNVVLTCIFTLDMVFNFFIALPRDSKDLSEDFWQTNQFTIASRYAAFPLSSNGRAGWFWIDLAAVCPGWLHIVLWLEIGEPHPQLLRSLVLLRIPRLYRMLVLRRWERFRARIHAAMALPFYIMDFTKFVVITTLACHWFALSWIMIEGKVLKGNDRLLDIHAIDEDEESWLSVLISAKGDPCTPSVDKNPMCAYVLALYWATMTLTTVGYGDVLPQNFPEYILCTLCMLISGFVWAFVVGSVVSLLSSLDPRGHAFKRTMDDLNGLMDDRGVPYELQVRLRRYMHEAKDTCKLDEQSRLLQKTVSPGLQGEVASCQSTSNLLRGCYWANGNIEEAAKLELVKAFRPMFFPPDEVVVVRQSVLVLTRGLMAVKGHILRRGDTWGHENILLASPSLIEAAQPRTLAYVSAMCLSKEALLAIAPHFPRLDARLRRAQVRTATRRAMIMLSFQRKSVIGGNGLLQEEVKKTLALPQLPASFSHAERDDSGHDTGGYHPDQRRHLDERMTALEDSVLRELRSLRASLPVLPAERSTAMSSKAKPATLPAQAASPARVNNKCSPFVRGSGQEDEMPSALRDDSLKM